MAETFKVDNAKIARAISLLTTVYNNPSEDSYLKARSLVESAAEVHTTAEPVRADNVDDTVSEFYQSSVKWLNDWIIGVRRGDLIIVGGWPFSGKTHFLTWLVTRFTGAIIDHFYFEDDPADVKHYYQKSGGAMEKTWLIDMKASPFTIPVIEQTVTTQKQSGITPDIIVLDHLDVMHSPGSGNDWADASAVVAGAKALARRLGVVVFAASLAYPKSNERAGLSRFYRAPMAKGATPDLVFMIDKIEHGEYYITREKAKGRDVSFETARKILQIDWRQMSVEDTML